MAAKLAIITSGSDVAVGTSVITGGIKMTRILGVPVSLINMQIAVETITAWARSNASNYICVRDVHGVMLAQENLELLAIHEKRTLGVLGDVGGWSFEKGGGPGVLGSQDQEAGKQYGSRSTPHQNRLVSHPPHASGKQFYACCLTLTHTEQ